MSHTITGSKTITSASFELGAARRTLAALVAVVLVTLTAAGWTHHDAVASVAALWQ